jgi:hypothetical protein
VIRDRAEWMSGIEGPVGVVNQSDSFVCVIRFESSDTFRLDFDVAAKVTFFRALIYSESSWADVSQCRL